MAEVGRCPNCGKSIDSGYVKSWCFNCDAPLPKEITDQLRIVDSRPSVGSDGQQAATSSSSSPIVNRYRDAYRVGGALVGIGDAIKAIGAVLGVIIAVLAFVSGSNGLGGTTIAVGVFIALMVGVSFWVYGVVVAAQGQILRATLDTAVASSHFLTDPERADAMQLPRSIVDRVAP